MLLEPIYKATVIQQQLSFAEKYKGKFASRFSRKLSKLLTGSADLREPVGSDGA